MRFWSEGMGDTELVMGLGEARLRRQHDHISLTGIVTSPAPWEYEVAMSLEDWATILKTATSEEACDFIARRVQIGDLISMALALAKFIVLLAWFTGARSIGGVARGPVPTKAPVGDAAPK